VPERIHAPDLTAATAWLNVDRPIGIRELRGHVVILDFWTYCCVNCMHVLPILRDLEERHANDPVVVIGVHSAKFDAEKDAARIEAAMQRYGVSHPVAVDSDYAIWRGFDNNYWPALYFIDAQGRTRHHHFGEGAYEQSEMIIQELLAQNGAEGISREPLSVAGRGLEAFADWSNLRSGENYVGYGRTQNFSSPGGAATDRPHIYAVPARLRLNDWALSGNWTVKKGAAALNEPNGTIAYRFHARDLHLVMGPAVPGTSVRFRVRIDGMPPGAAHGVDVDEQGEGAVTEQRLYQLIRQPQPITDRQFEIEFLGPGVETFAFTFG